MNNIFSEDEKRFIIDNYANMNTKKMVEILGKTTKQISSYAYKKGIKKTKQYRVYTNKEKQYILENYNKINNGEIAKYIGVTTKQINDFGLRNGLSRPTFIVDENYFKNIDNEHKAYWLGFLYADGCIVEDKRKTILSTELTLATVDKNHIEKFSKDIKSNYKISDRVIKDKYFASRVNISNTKFSQHLVNKGCVPRKSLILTFPNTEILPKHLIHHFIRGYFDGDGCMYVNKEKESYSVGFVGTEDFLNSIQDIVFDEVNLTKTTIQAKSCGKAFQVSWGGINNCKKWYDYLYKNATIWLDRKYEKFHKFVDTNYGFIYKLTCSINNKQFIGKKKYDNLGQWEQYIGGDNDKLKYAIKKYGKENFKREIIENCTTEIELANKEKYWIKYYNANNDENFYNIPIENKKHRKSKVICLNTMEIFNSISEASKKYNIGISLISSCCCGYVNSAGKLNGEFLRWEYYEDNKEYIYVPFTPSNWIRVVCLNDKKIFDSIHEAVRYYKMNENQNGIKECCEGKSRYSGLHPETKDCLVWMYYEDYIKLDNFQFKKVYKNKRVKCLNTNEVFDSLEMAKKWCGLKGIGHISNCCTGNRNVAGRHPITNEQLRWEYVN